MALRAIPIAHSMAVGDTLPHFPLPKVATGLRRKQSRRFQIAVEELVVYTVNNKNNKCGQNININKKQRVEVHRRHSNVQRTE